MSANLLLPHGRGAGENPTNRFERLAYEPVEADDPDAPALHTEYYRDSSRSLITYNDSPDVGFNASINPYRGCEHGCIYCYARPTHEYLGFSAGLDFESKIMVKEDAPDLLRKELASPKWRPQVVAMSGVTDCYQPIERRLQLTRRCLQVLAEFRNPVGIVTKSRLVTRDLDVLGEMAKHDLAAVFVSLTTLDCELARKLEPRASQPDARLAAIRELSQGGVPVGVMTAPMIPGLNDHELPKLIEAAVEAGAKFAGYTALRLPFAVKELFTSWLDRHFPDRKEKVLGRIRALRGGKLNDARFGSRMRGEGIFADTLRRLFQIACKKAGIFGRGPKLSASAFRRTGGSQGRLF